MALKKLIRFARIYGLRRSLYKAAGRIRKLKAVYITPGLIFAKKDVAVLGCGQFAFATIGAILNIYANRSYRRAYDVDGVRQSSLEKFYGVKEHAESVRDIWEDDDVKIVYIASNHASHTDYAIQSIAAGKTTYIEKPISVNRLQYEALCEAIDGSAVKVYFGYNRPFSLAIEHLKPFCAEISSPITMAVHVCGHVIGAEHWYREEGEGTRVCGNLGHWIDLAVHILLWNDFHDEWTIDVLPSKLTEPDDNVTVVMRSGRGDLIHFTITSRCEPFEGIREIISLQWGDVIAQIDDFRKMEVQRRDFVKKYSYSPKDVGHARAICQPFSSKGNRWDEVRLSTDIMLTIMEMLKTGELSKTFRFKRTVSI